MEHRKAPRVTPRPPTALPLVVFGLAVCLLPGPRASAHPLFRIHARPSLYRVAPPRLPQVRLPSIVRQSVGLIPQAASLASTASLARAVVTQAPVCLLRGRH